VAAAASHQHNQDCVVEYHALQLEPILEHATTHVLPYARRSLMGIVGPSDRFKLALFHETDSDVARVLKGLFHGLEALDNKVLQKALAALPIVSPVPIYEMQVDRHRGSLSVDTRDTTSLDTEGVTSTRH
jgi:hypothetical protein